MKKEINAGAALLVLPLLMWTGLASAQEQEQENPTFVPVEMYACDYLDRKGPKDLQRVVDKWNAWTDENDGEPYTAWALTPFIFAEQPFDVGWMGAWPDGNAMGKSLTTWLAKGSAQQAEFDKVIDCTSHSMAGSVMLRAPKMDWPTETGIAVFSDCTIAEGKTAAEAMAAHQEWVKHLDATGSQAGVWVFWPGFGSYNPQTDDEKEMQADYKIVGAHPDMRSVGKDWESYTNGGGWRVAAPLGEFVECDSPRLYHSELLRNGNFDPG